MNDANQIARSIRAKFKAHRIGKAAGGQDVLHFASQIDGILFLHRDVAIAGDPKGGGGRDGLTWEKLARVHRDQVFDEDEVVPFALVGDTHAATENFRDGNERLAHFLCFRIEQATGDDDL